MCSPSSNFPSAAGSTSRSPAIQTKKPLPQSWLPSSPTWVRSRPPPADSGSGSLDRKERPTLNGRELEVLRLVVQGLANKEIASRMNISESAVKNTLQQLFGKTEVRTRSQLVRVALERYRDLQ
jgi:DNA-binding NarL/FixJ family response regulator